MPAALHRHGGHGTPGVTYRYYTCSGRQRYGNATYAADRLPADALDSAVLGALHDTYARTDLFTQAAEAAAKAAESGREQREAELAAVSAEITTAEAAVDRYLGAFEVGDRP